MTLKLCTCRNCGHVTYKKRANPFCSSQCRNKFNTNQETNPNNIQSTAILTGAIDDQSSTANKD